MDHERIPPPPAPADVALKAASPQADALPALLLWGGATADELAQIVAQVGEAAGSASHTPDWTALTPAPVRTVKDSPFRLALVTSSAAELSDQLQVAAKYLRTGDTTVLLSARTVHLGTSDDAPGPLVMLFPGQGSQYPGMFHELARRVPVVAETLEEADQVLRKDLPHGLTAYLAPPEEESRREAARALQNTAVTQPIMLACDVAMLRLLRLYGVKPDLVAGHSLGEYAACVAAGVMSFPDALRAVALRARAMVSATPPGTDPGRMAAVAAPADKVRAALEEIGGYVIAANINSPRQTIISGESQAVADGLTHCAKLGWPGQMLPLSWAFHSRIVAAARADLERHFQQRPPGQPAIPVVANVTAREYPSEGGPAVAELLARQVMSPVEFMASVERLHELGGRTFLEVGPRQTLTSLVRRILRGRPHQALPTNHPDEGDLRSALNALAALAALGFPVEAHR